MAAELRCSFCGKHQDRVKRLVAGANALICNECVTVANRVMKEASGKEPTPWPAPPKPSRR